MCIVWKYTSSYNPVIRKDLLAELFLIINSKQEQIASKFNCEIIDFSEQKELKEAKEAEERAKHEKAD